jgi:hypothetical protein
LWCFWRTFFKLDNSFWMAFMFQGWSSISSGNQAPAKWQKMLQNSRIHPWRPSPTVHELADTVGINYGVCQEILTGNLNMCCIAVKFIP